MNDQDKAAVRRIFLLQLLNHEEFKELAKSWREKAYKTGSKIFSEGLIGNSMYIIVSGSVKISRVADGREKEITVLHSGDFFGEIALFEYVSRTASATALTEVSLLEISRDEFNGILSESPQIAAKILYQMVIEMSKRLRVTNYSGDRSFPITWI